MPPSADIVAMGSNPHADAGADWETEMGRLPLRQLEEILDVDDTIFQQPFKATPTPDAAEEGTRPRDAAAVASAQQDMTEKEKTEAAGSLSLPRKPCVVCLLRPRSSVLECGHEVLCNLCCKELFAFHQHKPECEGVFYRSSPLSCL